MRRRARLSHAAPARSMMRRKKSSSISMRRSVYDWVSSGRSAAAGARAPMPMACAGRPPAAAPLPPPPAAAGPPPGACAQARSSPASGKRPSASGLSPRTTRPGPGHAATHLAAWNLSSPLDGGEVFLLIWKDAAYAPALSVGACGGQPQLRPCVGDAGRSRHKKTPRRPAAPFSATARASPRQPARHGRRPASPQCGSVGGGGGGTWRTARRGGGAGHGAVDQGRGVVVLFCFLVTPTPHPDAAGQRRHA
jgi:hypothetical protein